MTFKKNISVVVGVIVLVLIGFYLIGLPWSLMLGGITFLIPATALTLLLEDFWRKWYEARDKLTWQYSVGAGIIVLSIISFLWAAESETTIEMVVRLGLTIFLGVVGGYWFHSKYKESISDFETQEREKWEKAKKRVARAKTKEAAAASLNKTLRFRLVGNSVDGDLDFSRPLALYKDYPMTYEELMAINDDHPDCKVAMNSAHGYIQGLVANLPVTETKEEIGG